VTDEELILVTGLIVDVSGGALCVDDGSGGLFTGKLMANVAVKGGFQKGLLVDVFVQVLKENEKEDRSRSSLVIVNVAKLNDPNFESLRMLEMVAANTPQLLHSSSYVKQHQSDMMIVTGMEQAQQQDSTYDTLSSLANTVFVPQNASAPNNNNKPVSSNDVYSHISASSEGTSLEDLTSVIQQSTLVTRGLLEELQLDGRIYQLNDKYFCL
jgi:hypothetical protein